MPPVSGGRFSVQIALHAPKTLKESRMLTQQLRKGPKVENMKIPADTMTWNLINYYVEELAREMQRRSFQTKRASGVAREGGYGFYVSLEGEELNNLKDAILEDNGPMARYLTRNHLEPILARVLFVDAKESGFNWHSDDTHNKIAKDTIVWHMNWMVTEDYVPGRASQSNSSSTNHSDADNNETVTKTVMNQVLDRTTKHARIKYLCGKDIVAIDYGADVSGQHKEKKAYLRIWDVEGETPEWDL
jgi:hypothetical protein